MDPAQPATMNTTQLEGQLIASLAEVPCLTCVFRICKDDLKNVCFPCFADTDGSCCRYMKEHYCKINNPTLIPYAQALNKALHT
uniref:WGS project CBMI000000000 data, contig CS3069_c004113 n=1 Tax=Fusarium clavum TaxID=2594811 RepID=A0A090MEE6_9HYPO|nr:unnamed protein product [Fusarium clavum]